MSDTTVFAIPTSTPSVANLREHWGRRSARAKAHRKAGFVVTNSCMSLEERAAIRAWGAFVHMVRVSKRQLDDDNLRGALKSLRDGIAAALGVDDGNPLVSWEYGQEKGVPATVRVTITLKRGGTL